MNNAAFLPEKKNVFRGLCVSVFSGAVGGFALTHTLGGALLGATLFPFVVTGVIGMFLGGCYLGMEAIPNAVRKFKFRHLKMGAIVRTEDKLAPEVYVAAPSQYLSTRVPGTTGTIVGWGDTVWVVQHEDGSKAAYNPEELIIPKP